MKGNDKVNLVDTIKCLFISFILTLLFLVILFGKNLQEKDLNIQLHDTYFVFSRISIISFFILLSSFLVLFTRGIWKKFSNPYTNSIILISGILIIVMLLLFYNFIKIGYNINTMPFNIVQIIIVIVLGITGYGWLRK